MANELLYKVEEHNTSITINCGTYSFYFEIYIQSL